MDELVSIEPDGSGPQQQHQDQHQQQRRKSKRAKSHVYTLEQCLEALSQLPGLIMMGYLPPAKANAIRSTLETILRHYQQTGSAQSGAALKDVDIMSVLRENPGLVNIFEPLLTDEQLEAILKEAKDGDDRET